MGKDSEGLEALQRGRLLPFFLANDLFNFYNHISSTNANIHLNHCICLMPSFSFFSYNFSLFCKAKKQEMRIPAWLISVLLVWMKLFNWYQEDFRTIATSPWKSFTKPYVWSLGQGCSLKTFCSSRKIIWHTLIIASQLLVLTAKSLCSSSAGELSPVSCTLWD